jgi:hypothetical protein
MKLALAALAVALVACHDADVDEACPDVEAEWRGATAALATDCSGTADCIVLGGASFPTCDCAATLPEIAARRDRVPASVREIFDRYHATCGGYRRLCDAAPSSVSCNGGRCQLVPRSCFPPPP